MLKNVGPEGIKVLTGIFYMVWNKGDVKEDWKIGIIAPEINGKRIHSFQ